MTDANLVASSFLDLDLPTPLLAALDKAGYETPTPIQAQTIPQLLAGLDLLDTLLPAPVRLPLLPYRYCRDSQ